MFTIYFSIIITKEILWVCAFFQKKPLWKPCCKEGHFTLWQVKWNWISSMKLTNQCLLSGGHHTITCWGMFLLWFIVIFQDQCYSMTTDFHCFVLREIQMRPLKKKIVSCKIIGLKNLMREGGKYFFFQHVSHRWCGKKKGYMGMKVIYFQPTSNKDFYP